MGNTDLQTRKISKRMKKISEEISKNKDTKLSKTTKEHDHPPPEKQGVRKEGFLKFSERISRSTIL